MYSVYEVVMDVLGYRTIKCGAKEFTVTNYIIASTPEDAIATCGAVLGREMGEKGTFAGLKVVDCFVVDIETIDLIAMHPQSLNPFVWDFEKGWCTPGENVGTCVRKDNINDFVALGMYVVWEK